MMTYTYTGSNPIFIPGLGDVQPGQTVVTELKIDREDFEIQQTQQEEESKKTKQS